MIQDEIETGSNSESSAPANQDSNNALKSKAKKASVTKKTSVKKTVAKKSAVKIKTSEDASVKKTVAKKGAVKIKTSEDASGLKKSSLKKENTKSKLSASTDLALGPPNLLIKMRNDIAPLLLKEFKYKSIMQVPALTKVVLNIGMGSEALQNAKTIDAAVNDMSIITGQKPIVTRARKSIAAFKLREGMPIGVSVTLRRRKMYEFMERFISSALPRIRDFRGLNRNCFDGRGNCAIGIKEQVIFPEIDYNSIDKLRGLQVIICTSANSDVEGIRFLELLGMPFVKK